MRSFLLVCTFFLLSLFSASAQKEWNIWYFGDRAGLDFTHGSPAVLRNGLLTTREGCASVCNYNGKLLFYTDGMSVWNATHALMPNGSFLGGDTSSTQSALILPRPGSRKLYYIFTASRAETEPIFGLQCATVDLSAPQGGGLGDVVEKNVVLLTTATEKLTAVRHRNGIDAWVIAHDFGNNLFYAYLVTSGGVGVPVVSAIGTPYKQGIGYLKASHDSKRLAAAVDFNLFELYDFNNSTGQVSNPIPLATPDAHVCYGVEFSPDNRLLYASKASQTNDASQNTVIWQYDLMAGTPAQIENSALVVGEFANKEGSAGALQLGPDGRIYAAVAGNQHMGVITDPDVRGECGFQPKGIDLETGTCEYGLPNFHPAYGTAEFSYINLCFGDTTYFSIAPDLLPADSVFWDFGDPVTSPHDTMSRIAGAYRYKRPGTYTVLLTIRRNGTLETISRNITIGPPLKVDIGKDVLICAGKSAVINATNKDAASYLWSTGASSATITVSQAGEYWVRVSNGVCEASDTIIVTVNSPQLTITSNTAICRGESVQLTTSAAEEMSYRWEPIDGLNNPAVPTPVARPTTTTTYTVTATNKLGCTTSASITVRVDNPIHIELGDDRVICHSSTAVLDATTTGATYLWSTGETTPVISVAKPGVYAVVVSVGSCSAMDAIAISVIAPTISVGPGHTICAGEKAQLQANGAVVYEWSPTAGLDNPLKANPVASPQQTTTYRVVGTTAAGCRDTAYVTVTINTSLDINLGKDTTLCAGTQLKLTAPLANARYRWSTGETTASITVKSAGLYSLVVTMGSCTASDDIRVDFSAPSVAVEHTRIPICPGDSAQLAAHGAVSSYSWAPAAGLSNPAIASPLAFPEKTTLYTVTGTDEYGCTTSASLTVEVVDGKPVVLSLPHVSGMMGDKSDPIPITIETDAAGLPIMLRNLRVEVRINASVFAPEPGPFTVNHDGKDLVLTFAPGDIELTQPMQTLAEIKGNLLAGDSTFVVLRFGDIEHDRCIQASTRPGSLALGGCFPASRSMRIFTPQALDVAPNPAADAAIVRLRAFEPGAARLVVHSTEGRLVLEQDITVQSSDQTIPLSLRAIPAGVYRIALISGASVQTAIISVTR